MYSDKGYDRVSISRRELAVSNGKAYTPPGGVVAGCGEAEGVPEGVCGLAVCGFGVTFGAVAEWAAVPVAEAADPEAPAEVASPAGGRRFRARRRPNVPIPAGVRIPPESPSSGIGVLCAGETAGDWPLAVEGAVWVWPAAMPDDRLAVTAAEPAVPALLSRQLARWRAASPPQIPRFAAFTAPPTGGVVRASPPPRPAWREICLPA